MTFKRRTQKGGLARRAARAFISLFGLNRLGLFATEVAQAINPVARVETPHGTLLCKGGHGRLVWRAFSFFTEEPETIAWLDTLKPGGVLWDIGANVGLYAIYAAKFRGCRSIDFGPESQNFALPITPFDSTPPRRQKLHGGELSCVQISWWGKVARRGN